MKVLIREEIAPAGVDLVVEVGGIGTLNESIRSTRIGGSIALIGVVAGPAHGEVRLPLIVMQQQRIQGVTVGSTEELQSMVRAIDAHKMHPVVDRVFSFEDRAPHHEEIGAVFTGLPRSQSPFLIVRRDFQTHPRRHHGEVGAYRQLDHLDVTAGGDHSIQPRFRRLLREMGYRGHLSIELFNRAYWQAPLGEVIERCYRGLARLLSEA